MRRPFSTVPRVAVLLLALGSVATAAACQQNTPAPPVAATAAGPGPATPAFGTTAPSSTAWPTDGAGNPVGWQMCRNTVHHFEIAYPGGWHTASLGPDDACAAFDPAEFTVTDGPGLVTQQLFAFYAPEDALDYLGDLFPTDFYTITSQSEVTVAGLHAIRYTVTTLPARGPAGPTYPVGTTLYGYVVTAGARSIDVGTWAAPADASGLPARQHVVDQAVTTVHFT